jgi:hypothetical protein
MLRTVILILTAMVLSAVLIAPVVAEVTEPAFTDTSEDMNDLAIQRVTELKVMQGYDDGSFHPSDAVSETEFSKTLDRMFVACPDMAETAFETKAPKAKVSRVRVVTALMRGIIGKRSILGIDVGKTLRLFSDWKSIPEWAAKYVAFGVAEGYLDADRKFRPDDPMTRSELAGVSSRCIPTAPRGVVAGVTAYVPQDLPAAPKVSRPKPSGSYTGLVVDCRGLGMLPCMSPVVVSEGGGQVYPDRKHLPSMDYIEEVGIASYVSDLSSAKRAGDNPILVTAVRVEGSSHEIAVVSDSDGDMVLSAEKGSHFLRKYQVTFLVDPR